jgi:hypothetical protein
MTPSFLRAALVCLLLMAPLQAVQQPDPGAKVTAELETAVARVKEIVNQPVTRLLMGPGDKAALFRPGWFHEGAITPDFDHVDVRASRECAQYARWPYVTPDVTPGTRFIGSELEFNPTTKFFCTDRSQPKKKLTEQEMLEINDLYRSIGRCVKRLKELQAPSGGTGNPAPDTKLQEVRALLQLPAAAAPVGENAPHPQREMDSPGVVMPP